MTMPKTAIKIGPQDHGRRLSLADFEHAEVQEGYLYELSRGVITVSDVPGRKHLAQVLAARHQFSIYEVLFPKRLYGVMTGDQCKILLNQLDSERHPDLSIYKTPPPETDEFWQDWILEIVIEVVSLSSAHRD